MLVLRNNCNYTSFDRGSCSSLKKGLYERTQTAAPPQNTRYFSLPRVLRCFVYCGSYINDGSLAAVHEATQYIVLRLVYCGTYIYSCHNTQVIKVSCAVRLVHSGATACRGG